MSDDEKEIERLRQRVQYLERMLLDVPVLTTSPSFFGLDNEDGCWITGPWIDAIGAFQRLAGKEWTGWTIFTLDAKGAEVAHEPWTKEAWDRYLAAGAHVTLRVREEWER